MSDHKQKKSGESFKERVARMMGEQRAARKNPPTSAELRRLNIAVKPKQKERSWPKADALHKKASAHANRVDPNWEMADKPSLTKGHKIYNSYYDKK